MENPVEEISGVIHLLTQSPPTIQKATLEKYFTPDAKFVHPFCRTGSSSISRWLMLCIYQWYKILSPRIDLTVKSVAFDEKNLILYVSIFQIFRIWFIPFYSAPVHLTTVLQLSAQNPEASVTSNSNKTHYWITEQNDLYQSDQFTLFIPTLRVGYILVLLSQYFATFMCVAGSVFGYPFTWYMDNVEVHAHAKRLEEKKQI